MNRHVTITVTAELPPDLFDAAQAILSAKTAFNELQLALDAASITASVAWEQNAVSAAPVIVRQKGRRGIWMTPARLALAASLYPVVGVTTSEITQRVNALPGARDVRNHDIYAYCSRRGLRRPIVSDAQKSAAAMRAKLTNGSAGAHA